MVDWKRSVFLAVNVVLFVLNLLIFSGSESRQAQAEVGRAPAQGVSANDEIQGTIRLVPSRRPRTYELIVMDPANRLQIEAELVNRLNGRIDGRVEDSWLDPNRTPDGGFRMFYVLSWER